MIINEAIELLKSYNGPFELTLHKGANETLLKEVEFAYGITLPDDFKTLYRFTDGFEIDEDILNIIPLWAIIETRKNDAPIWIAEYMIYCDRWDLELNPAEPNDYSISVIDGDSGKIILTNSLGEFIARSLKGVFEIGGLYHWADEIKARTYGNTDPTAMKPLFWVFSQCLKLGLISKKEVIDRADWIISTEVEPHHFFIGMSLCHSLDDLLAVLNSIYPTEDILQIRAVFGEVRLKLLIDKITTDKALSILDKFVNENGFTPYEMNEMRYLIEEWDNLEDRPKRRLQQKLGDRIKMFFNNYSGFNLYNHKHWHNINDEITKKLSTQTV
jgi:hypothetical protein